MGPRIGFSYMLTKDAKNIIRGSYVRVHEQMMGRDAVTTFGAGAAAEQRDIYDNRPQWHVRDRAPHGSSQRQPCSV